MQIRKKSYNNDKKKYHIGNLQKYARTVVASMPPIITKTVFYHCFFLNNNVPYKCSDTQFIKSATKKMMTIAARADYVQKRINRRPTSAGCAG